MNGKPGLIERCSKYDRGTSERSWHTNFTVPSNLSIKSYDWRTTKREDNVWNFVATEIKFDDSGDESKVSFEITDIGYPAYAGDASDLKMYLTVHLNE